MAFEHGFGSVPENFSHTYEHHRARFLCENMFASGVNTLDVTECLFDVLPIMRVPHRGKADFRNVSVHEMEYEVDGIEESTSVLAQPVESGTLQKSMDAEAFAVMIIINKRLLCETFLRIQS